MEGATPVRQGRSDFIWCGAHGKGAMRAHRANKRAQAAMRDTLTLPENRRKARLARERKAGK